MLRRLKAMFPDTLDGGQAPRGDVDLALAVAVLLVETAHMDGSFDADERTTIRDIVANRLGLVDVDPDGLIATAERRVEEAGELWSFARVAKNSYAYEDRIKLIELLWEVAYADGELHDYESELASPAFRATLCDGPGQWRCPQTGSGPAGACHSRVN